MSPSDDFGLEDDDTEFIAVATQLEASQNGDFNASPRPTKQRRIGNGLRQMDGASFKNVNRMQSDDGSQDLAQRFNGATAQSRGQPALLNSQSQEDLEYYFPGELGEDDERLKRNSKYKIHVPRIGGQFKDQIFTHTQGGLDTSLSQFRGAVWKAAQPPPPSVLRPMAANANMRPQINAKSATGPRQTTLSSFTTRSNGVIEPEMYDSDAKLAARLQAEENSHVTAARIPSKSQTTSLNNGSSHISEELADLPSDAFSSSPEQPSAKDIITISSQSTTSQARTQGLRGPQHGLKQMTIFGQPATQDLSASQAETKRHAWPMKARNEPPTHHKLDERAMETWVYPTNLGNVRDYQYNIVTRSLFHNTLVALPTGLGKTFIAATVMLNYYRWTKDAQIVFMAPTKPLIAQQMEACYGIVGIPRRDTVLMTGETSPALRTEEWLEKRVFFMTPQTVINDLKTGICDPKKIVLVVVDEAHKATGGYAYTEVINFLRRFNNSFRVQALTATPGGTVEAVQSVIDNLGIARVELRTEQSLDIRQYTHEKHTQTELFDFSDEQSLIMEHFSKALRPVLEKLCTQNAYWSRDPMQLTAYGLTNARQKWMASDAGRKAAAPLKGMVNAIFTVLASLAHSITLLKFHGIGPFYSGCLEFQKNVETGQTKGKNPTQIVQSEDFTKMMRTMRTWTSNKDFIGHPKLEYLREVVLNHFLDAGEGAQGSEVPPSATRVMVFASYRDSTEEICRVLKRSEPMIRPHVFVGQAASKGSEGMDQKRQNAVIQDFKSGKYNTLVATSIGEEGLDIGTVDLIVCYDASSSPIRMLQRIGRTGRKRVGNVVLLLMKGKEENDYAKAQDNYAYIQKTIADPGKYSYRDDQSPRILPKGIQPVVDKRIIEIPVENSQPIDLNEKGRKAKGKRKTKRPPKKFHMPDGVRTGFVKASKMESDLDDDSAEDLPAKRPRKKGGFHPTNLKEPVLQRELEPIALPYLQDVLLNNEQDKQLERKYAHTANEDADGVVLPPDITHFPESFRQMGVTKYVSHGGACLAVQNAISAIQMLDGAKVERMKGLVCSTYLEETGSASGRLVSPSNENGFGEEDLPSIPSVRAGGKKSTNTGAQRTQNTKRTAPVKPATTAQLDTSNSAPAVKKARGRPRKKAPMRPAISYGSAAEEGGESSPEPTPANMRLGTQGIDLGSRDTSGEDEDEDYDSDLAEFVVNSDQPIEIASSSQQMLNDNQPSASPKPNRKRMKVAARRSETIIAEVDSGSEATYDDADSRPEGLRNVDVEDSDVDGGSAAVANTSNASKRRIIDDSDDDV